VSMHGGHMTSAVLMADRPPVNPAVRHPAGRSSFHIPSGRFPKEITHLVHKRRLTYGMKL
jgi:hypothetical protein